MIIDPRFLWASLKIDQILKPKTVSMIRKVLQEMPTSIFEVFDQDLLRVKREDDGSSLALRLYLWLAFAKIPLPFAALAHALSIDPEDEFIDRLDDENITSIEDLIDICCGFVMADGDFNLRFVHFTVQEYSQSHPEKLHPFDESTVAKVCLSYLHLKDFEYLKCKTEHDIFQRLKEYPLLYYASHWWADHLTLASRREIEPNILGIYLNRGKFRNYSQVFYWHHRGRRGRSWLPRRELFYAQSGKGYTPASQCRYVWDPKCRSALTF